MTRNKDQKRLIRARMKKTGESYTAARSVLVARKRKGTAVDRGTAVLEPEAAAAASTATVYAAPPEQWPALAGKSDATMKAKTGRTWAEWVDALDADGAHAWNHTRIAQHVYEQHGVSGWWSQSVAVGYERIRGLREVGQTCDGKFEASKSRTFGCEVGVLYGMFADARRRAAWLPQGIARVRTASENKSMRWDWEDGTQVHVYFVPKGAKCSVSVQHVKLGSKQDIERMKSFWTERLQALGEAL